MNKLPNAIGRFEVVDRIGQGGMGELLLAWDPLLERQIAIKLLKEAGNEDLRARFTREARAVARLRHRHIVAVFDVGEHEGQPFIAMEYIQGHTLAEYVRRPERVPVLRILEWIADVADGLAYAHRAGIVHRDVKPANVMIDNEGSIKILDFGIARVADSSTTQKGLLIGTLNYMSPEQLSGAPVDGRSDMFALGAVLYELLCRRQAFPGNLDSGVLGRIMYQQPDPVEQLCPGIDPAVVRIVQTALQKEASNRYPDLVAMRRELQRVHRHLSSRPDLQVTAAPDETTVVIDQQTPVRTPRRGTAASEFGKRREAQIELHLQEATAALAASDYEQVIAACERALLMDPNLERAAEMLEQARLGLDKRQAERWLAEGQDELRRGAVTAAARLLDQARVIMPDSDAALSLKRAIEETQEARRQERERAEALQRALEQAQTHFDAGEYEQVIRACDAALAIEPQHERAQRLKTDAAAALEERARRAAERDARDVVVRAQGLSGAGRIEDALALLESAPPHALVQSAQQELAVEFKRIQQEREYDRRAGEVVTEAHRLFAAGDAAAALQQLRQFRPVRASITTAIKEIEEAVERRRKEEEAARQQRIAAATAAARADMDRGDHAAALERLRPIQAEASDTPSVAVLIAQAEAAIVAREKARRLAAQIEQHLSDAAIHLERGDLDDAQFRVQAALKLDKANARASALKERIDAAVRSAEEKTLLQERDAALTRERLEQQRLKELQEAARARSGVETRTPGRREAGARSGRSREACPRPGGCGETCARAGGAGRKACAGAGGAGREASPRRAGTDREA